LSQLSFEDAVSEYRLIGEDIDDTLKDIQVILPSYTTLSHNVASSTPRLNRTRINNVSGDMH
jgi:hypothetical protein